MDANPIPEWARRARERWRFRGSERPRFANVPESGRESVWDYPRPPVVVSDPCRVVVRAGARVVADTRAALRVLETASPPTFYLPPEDVDLDLIRPTDRESWCEWKGMATYRTVVLPDATLECSAWSYPDPWPGYERIASFLSFYPSRLECHVGAERVVPQPGGFYGGWVTSDVVGPFKGAPGTEDW